MHPFSQQSFTARDILWHEAEALAKHGPSRGEPKEPTCNLETFTRLRDIGAGACRIKQWLDDEDPYAWGCRNKALLLDEPIHSPAKWKTEEEYRGPFNDLLQPLDHAYTGGGLRVSDEGSEEQLLPILISVLRRVTAIAFVFVIQLWRRNPEYISHPDYHVVFDALHHFSMQRIRTSNGPQSHDIGIIVPRTFYPQSMDKHERFRPLVIGNVLRTGFTEKIYAANDDCKTADEVLTSMLDDDDDADSDTNGLFRKFGLRNDFQSAAVGHVIKMSHIASLCTSQMGLSTSMWGYLRFFIQIETNDGRAPILYVTKNLATSTAWSGDFRLEKSSNFEFLCCIYYFVIMVLLKTQGPRVLPPDLRNKETLLNFFPATAAKRSNLLLRCYSLPRVVRMRVSGLLHDISFSLWAVLWVLILWYFGTGVLGYVGYLRTQLIGEDLERIGPMRRPYSLYLRFDSWDVRDVTEIGISRRAGLVLKVFHSQTMFESELRAYLALQEAGIQFIPQLLGIFNVPGTKGAMLLTMVGERINEPFTAPDRRHLDAVINDIHAAQIHHHDLRLDNIVCGVDGRLRIIDFRHSSIADECKAAELCPDQVFLNLWVK